MLQATGEFAVYFETAPDIEFRADGMAHITYRIGNLILRVVMRPCLFQSSLADAHEKHAKWCLEQLDHAVVELPVGKRGRH